MDPADVDWFATSVTGEFARNAAFYRTLSVQTSRNDDEEDAGEAYLVDQHNSETRRIGANALPRQRQCASRGLNGRGARGGDLDRLDGGESGENDGEERGGEHCGRGAGRGNSLVVAVVPGV